MLFSYFVSERAAREARRRARILAQRKRRTIIRYSLVLFAILLLLIAGTILFSRTSVYTEPSDERVNPHEDSENALATDRQQALEQQHAGSNSDIQLSTHAATYSQSQAEHQSNTHVRDEIAQRPAESGSKLDNAAPLTASVPTSNTSHRLASVSNEDDVPSEAAPASIQDNSSSGNTRLSQLSVRQQPLDTIGDEEGGNGIIITLDKKASQPAASRKEDPPNGSQTENISQAELKTDAKVSSADGTPDSHTNSYDAADAQAPTTNYKSSLQLTSMDTNTKASQETRRTAK